MPWMMLTPREIEKVMNERRSSKVNSALLGVIQEKLDTQRGDLTLTDAEYLAVQQARLNWRGGHEKAFQAVIDAARRHV